MHFVGKKLNWKKYFQPILSNREMWSKKLYDFDMFDWFQKKMKMGWRDVR